MQQWRSDIHTVRFGFDDNDRDIGNRQCSSGFLTKFNRPRIIQKCLSFDQFSPFPIEVLVLMWLARASGTASSTVLPSYRTLPVNCATGELQLFQQRYFTTEIGIDHCRARGAEGAFQPLHGPPTQYLLWFQLLI